MHRFYADPERSSESSFRLTPEDAFHALRVLRLQEGDPVEVIYLSRRFSAVIESASGDQVTAVPSGELPPIETKIRFVLFQGLPKGDKMEWIVQKAAELGVSAVVPVQMSRCVVKLDPKDALKKRERWQKIAREAGKQSGRCVIPEISLPVPLTSLSERFSGLDAVAVPWENRSGYGPIAFYRSHPSLTSLGIVIGPEGGIDEQEISFLTSLPCETITLGPRILRTETAGLAAVSALSALYGEME